MYDAYIYDAAEILSRKDQRTNKPILGVGCIYDPRSLTLMHVCMMHVSMILDPDSCVYDTYINDP